MSGYVPLYSTLWLTIQQSYGYEFDICHGHQNPVHFFRVFQVIQQRFVYILAEEDFNSVPIDYCSVVKFYERV
mgnify:CR=1 FL=1